MSWIFPKLSWIISPRIPIFAPRPWFNSMIRFRIFHSSVCLSQPKPRKPFRKSPRNSLPGALSQMSDASRLNASMTSQVNAIWAQTATGTAGRAAKPARCLLHPGKRMIARAGAGEEKIILKTTVMMALSTQVICSVI